jgi:CRP-like cAMP-binding protein
MAFFGDGRRTATVRARTPMKLLVGNPRSFRSMLTNPTLAGRIRAVVAARRGQLGEE